MAIYHAHVSSGSRAGGQSGAAKVAYVLREGKYAGRYDLVVSGHGNLPAWAGGDPRALFAAADLHERANGRLFLEIEVALPNDLAETQQHELARSIAAAGTAPGLPFTYAIHAGRPKSAGEPANPHVHILISERVNDGIPRDAEQWFRRANSKRPELGGAAKHRGLKERSWVDDTRKLIAGLMNEHLELARAPARVTSDSHATRIARAVASGDVETAEYLRQHPPGIHLGPTVAALERDRFRQRKGEEPELSRAGEPTGRGDRNRAGAAAGARIRERVEFVATESSRARVELQRATEAVEAARSAGLTDEAILGIYEESESVGSGSGWGAVEAATASQAGRRRRAEAAAGKVGIDVEAVYRNAAGRGVDRVAAVEQAASVFVSARSALLTDTEVWRIHGEAESTEEGSGWVAVEAATAARVERKQLAETGAEEAGITAGDIAAVYAAASSRDTDPVAALEEETATQLAAEARRSARRTALFGTPGGREAYVAALTARGANGDPGELSGADIDRALAAAEAAEHLERVRALFEDEAGRTCYGAAVRELGDRYGMQQIAGAVTAAEGFVRRVGGLSDVGHAVLDAALGKGEELPVADLEAVLERAEEQERKESARRREEQRWVELDRRAEDLRASGRGARCLREAEHDVLAGADRRATLDEWASVVGTAERWLGAHLDGLEAEIGKQADGAALLRQLQPGRGEDGSSRLSLRERENLIDSASRWLRAWERQEKLFAQRDGKPLYYGKLDELDPGWRDTGRVRITHVEQALKHGETTLAGRARRAAALRERHLASRLGTLREHDVGGWLYAIKLDELAPGWRQRGGAASDRREQAIEWAERQVARIEVLRVGDVEGFLAAVARARIPATVERAFAHAEGRLAARQREAAERARLEALDQEIARRRDEVLKASPAAGDALLLQAGFGESREKRVAALDEVEHSLAEDFARREQVLTAGGGAAFLEDARRKVLGAARGPATLGERGGVVAEAEQSRAAAERRGGRGGGGRREAGRGGRRPAAARAGG
ncbi:MAG: MobA/MobL family protein, partial [Acidobacteria bacterium]|nr:MobA/MobL family protein [Acidobacteriota bacterium]